MQIYGLKPGVWIRIKKTFRDIDGTEHAAGLILKLISSSCFPYDDGWTLTFDDGRVIRLSGNVPENSPIMDDKGDVYWELYSG